MKKVSVIIPMYNSENYVKSCIQSVTGQSYGNLEIILVDDGSTDQGVSVCRELAEADGRIRLFRQENQGVSAARNHGIDAATGEYVFFLDSDDAIHPFLIEKMLQQAETNHAQLAFCGYRKLDGHGMEAALDGGADLRGAPPEKGGPERWLTADEAGTEEWFHVKYTDTFSGIGGKLILREALGNLRFDRGLINGEDTFFLYQLVRGQVKSVYCLEEWYYYRMHGESVTNTAGTARGMGYFESARRIRDGEYESGHGDFAMRWEILTVDQIRRSRAAQLGRDAGQELRKIAMTELRHPLFRRICFSDRLLFRCCFACYPLYVILNSVALNIVKRRR